MWVTAHLGEILRHLAWHLPQVFPCYLPLINYILLSFTDFILWQSMPFSYRKQTSGEKRWLSCGGDITICPLLHWFQLPCHSQAELSSMNSLRAWGRDKNSTMTVLWYWWTRKSQRTGSPPWRKWLGN